MPASVEPAAASGVASEPVPPTAVAAASVVDHPTAGGVAASSEASETAALGPHPAVPSGTDRDIGVSEASSLQMGPLVNVRPSVMRLVAHAGSSPSGNRPFSKITSPGRSAARPLEEWLSISFPAMSLLLLPIGGLRPTASPAFSCLKDAPRPLGPWLRAWSICLRPAAGLAAVTIGILAP